MSGRGSGGGWGTFAATVFAIVGISNLMQGLTALFRKQYFSESGLAYSNLRFWAIVWLVIGFAQVGAAIMLIGRSRGGRTLGIVLASGAAVVAFLSMGANTAWSLAVLGMNLLIVYGLTAHPGAYSAEGVGTEPAWTSVADRPAVPPSVGH
jgi:hypothetical protein